MKLKLITIVLITAGNVLAGQDMSKFYDEINKFREEQVERDRAEARAAEVEIRLFELEQRQRRLEISLSNKDE